MGRFTRIPETNLAGALGGTIGQAAGTVIGNVKLTAETKVQKELDDIYQKLTTGYPLSQPDLDKTQVKLDRVEETVHTLEKSILAVEKSASVLETTASSVKVPVVALKVTLNITKYLPLPQAPLVTSVSALQADLIQTLSELVAQIEQVVGTLLTTVKLLLEFLQKLKTLLEKFKRIINLLKINLAFLDTNISEHDQEVLKNTGIIDTEGTLIFNQLLTGLRIPDPSIIWIGNYRTIDTGSLVVENQVKSAEPGTSIYVSIGSVGTWITEVYSTSDKKPKKPVGQDLVPRGWSATFPTGERGWSSRGTVSGLTGKVLSWTEPVACLVAGNWIDIKPETEKVNIFRMSEGKLQVSSFNLEEANAVVLSGPDEAYLATLNLLQDLDQSPLSQDLKNKLTIEINPQEDQSEPGTTAEWYLSGSGDKYKMSLKASSVSPRIATLRYIEVTDETGTVVYEGSQTFATDPRILFEETRVKLTQLFG